MNKLLELSKIFERFIDKKKGLKKVLTSLGIDETAYNKLPIADKLKITDPCTPILSMLKTPLS